MEDKLVVGGVFSKGYGNIPKLVMQDRNLGSNAKLIYAYLCSFAGGGMTAFPSRDKICYDLNISKDTFTKYMKQLVDNGYVNVEKHKDKGKYCNNVYTLCLEIKTIPNSSDTEKTDTDFFGHGETDTNNNNNNNNNNSFNNNNNNTYTRFKKPSIEEIQSYIDEKEYDVDAEMFYDFYESKGWLVGKNKMKDWKAAVRTWNRNRKDNNGYNQVKGKSSEARRKFGETSMSDEEVQRGLKKMFGNQISD